MFIFVWTVGKSVFIAVYISVLRVADSFPVRWTLLLCIHLTYFYPSNPELAVVWIMYLHRLSVHASIYQCLCSHTKQPLCIISETLRTSDGNNSHKCLIGYKNTCNHFSTQKPKNRKFVGHFVTSSPALSLCFACEACTLNPIWSIIYFCGYNHMEKK